MVEHSSNNPDNLPADQADSHLELIISDTRLAPFADPFQTDEVPVQKSTTDAAGDVTPEPSVRRAVRKQIDPAPGLGVMLSKIMWLSAAALIVMGIWYVGPNLVEQYHYAAIKGRTQAQYDLAKVALKDEPLANLSMAYQLVANRIRPSVVHIDTTSQGHAQAAEGMPEGMFHDFQFESKGQGSGVILDPEGYIMTNEHVVSGATKIRVTLSDRRTYEARVIGTDLETDLALLKIEAKDLIAADWGDSDEATIGSLVWAVGSPFGLTQSVTHGIVSASHRRVDNPYQDLLQTDAPINPGNSGGPLVNANGEVIGINTSILGKSYQGVSFAVSSVVARDVFEKLKKNAKVQRGFLGVKPSLVTPQNLQQLKLTSLDGALIELVESGSPAEQAGIREGDVIIAWNGESIDSDLKLFRHVGMTQADSTVEVKLIRDGQETLTRVVVGKKPEIRFLPRR
jgi:serine protease Do